MRLNDDGVMVGGHILTGRGEKKEQEKQGPSFFIVLLGLWPTHDRN